MDGFDVQLAALFLSVWARPLFALTIAGYIAYTLGERSTGKQPISSDDKPEDIPREWRLNAGESFPCTKQQRL